MKARMQPIEALAGGQQELPPWISALDEEDLVFLRSFLWSSGSLKDLATEFNVSYPTIRARLDRLIAKTKEADKTQAMDPLERLVRTLMADGQISFPVGKKILSTHKKSS